MVPQFRRRHFSAHVPDCDGGNGDSIPPGAQRRSDRIIVCQAIGDTDESTDLDQGFALERNRRAEARLCQLQSQAHDDVWQEVRVDAQLQIATITDPYGIFSVNSTAGELKKDL